MSRNGSDGADQETAPNATVFVRNINERIKLPVLVETLKELFSTYGTVLEVVAKRSLKRRGQAFVCFDEIESAASAVEELNDFELFGKQLSVNYAKTRSDVTVLNEDGEEALAAHKRERLTEKRRKQEEEAAKAALAAEGGANKRKLEDGDTSEQPAKIAKITSSIVEVPDEYLPANPTLTLREIPSDTSKEELIAAFGSYAGFKDARSVPGRPLAFVEYVDADSAAAAKAATSGITIRGHTVKVTFRRA